MNMFKIRENYAKVLSLQVWCIGLFRISVVLYTKMSYVDHIVFTSRALEGIMYKTMSKRNEFGNFDEKRRKFGDPLVYRPAAFFFFFFLITTTVS